MSAVSASTPLKIGMVAGELSGDKVGGALIEALKKQYEALTVSGMAGPRMIAAGATSLFPLEKLSVMGLIEPLKHLPEILKIRRTLVQHFIQEKIDLFIGIDSPDFNLGLEIQLRTAGIKTVHYVSPSVWAWRRWRCRKIARAVDLMMVLFPFEEDFYRTENIPAKYVGHPLADEIPYSSDKKSARIKLNLSTENKILAVLPGSRLGELKQLSELFIKTAAACVTQIPDLLIVAAMANTRCENYFKKVLEKTAPNLPVTLIRQDSLTVMQAADSVLLASGTATLECALVKRPMVVSYRVSILTAMIVKRLLTVKFFALPNLLLNKMAVPEFIQDKALVNNLTPAVVSSLTEDQTALINSFMALHQQLRCDAAEKAAIAVNELLTSRT